MRISDWSSDVCSSDLGAVAEDAAVAVRREPPALPFIGEGAERLQVPEAPAMADAALPGDADDLVAPARDAFTELVGRQRRLGQRLARFEIEARDARTPILAGAFVEMTVVPEEPLSEAVRVVRPGEIGRAHG